MMRDKVFALQAKESNCIYFVFSIIPNTTRGTINRKLRNVPHSNLKF